MESTDPLAHENALFINSTVNSVYELITAIPGSHLAISYIKNAYQNDPFRIALELFLVFFAIKYMLSKKYKPNDNNVVLTDKEVDDLVEEWQPEPLAPKLSAYDRFNLEKVPTIVGPQSAKAKVAGHTKPLMNLATSNYLNLVASDQIRQKAVETLRNYGVGSCGPPGFYGTIDVHMDLERDIARFLGTDDAIIYAQGFSTISSVIPAFCKRGDYLVVDDGVCFAVQKGVQISRSIIRTFKHNDMEDLERVLKEIDREHTVHRKRLTRRFIVTEGLFANFGDIAPLDKLVELKKKFKYRLILDESQSIGVLGRKGAGLTDLYNIDAKEVDMIVGSLANALCGSGGFCAGSIEVIDHQRLSGSAYCFSASMPAMLAVSASEAFRIIEQQPNLLKELAERISSFRQILAHKSLDSYVILDPPHDQNLSPFFHIRIKESYLQTHTQDNEDQVSREAEERLLQEVVDECAYQGVLITRAKYVYEQELHCPRPSIKISVTTGLSKKENDKAANVVKTAIVKIFSKWRK
ncbi:Serine palmitoyltransferase 1 [Choanephora cucurbitarum]|uniref:serine C-palmitoyltransferase n=1 Tax=Choanephora cucurbitarum TaxID=101091 RepID=A0A1C7N0D5_9FUNG|nr:Serine palmitoyltransferase 1 [Choanephora cucurbitarum]